jgi:hypothetical protein
MSVDFWDGTSKDPSWNIKLDKKTSLVKSLPSIIHIIMNPIEAGEYPILLNQSLKEEIEGNEGFLILESVAEDIFDEIVDLFEPGEIIDISKMGQKNYGFYNTIKKSYPQFFEKEGRKTKFSGDIDKFISMKDEIINKTGILGAKVSTGGRKETTEPNNQEKEIEKSGGIEKVAYEEQLRHLKLLMKLVIKGSSNALFLCGRGGIGKTQTVEDELSKAGLRDGDGYFKNAGSASPIGIYTTLYANRKDIIVFDDSDSALNDQEGRNLIKAATDTKKVRKISWNKKSSVIIPANQFEEMVDESDDGLPADKNGNPVYPNSFEFTGRVIFISNLTLNKLDPDGALRTRGYIIDINPTDAEVIDYMEKIAPNIKLEGNVKLPKESINEVIDVIRQSKNKNEINLRKLVRGLNIKAEMGDDPDWKTILRLYA